jgi:hypothetical protein
LFFLRKFSITTFFVSYFSAMKWPIEVALSIKGNHSKKNG